MSIHRSPLQQSHRTVAFQVFIIFAVALSNAPERPLPNTRRKIKPTRYNERLDRFGQAFYFAAGASPRPTVKIMLLSSKSSHTPHLQTRRTRSPVRRWGAMGAPPVAESSDLSEWQRSVCNAGAPSPRRTPGTATGEHLRVNTENESFCLCQVRTQSMRIKTPQS